MDRIVQNIVEKPLKNIKDICVGPLVSDEGMVNFIQLENSFGYDCKKLYNLCAIQNTVIYISGNIIHFLDTETGEIKLQRSVRCTGIGHIAANYAFKNIAVGERGQKPSIYILSWTKLDVISTLTNGTEKAFAYLDFNHDGTILCSLGTAPDFTLALWDWKKSVMLVKCEAANRPVYKAAFSKVQPEVIISSGEGHIKFWQTAKTFTGVKLTGEIGKFGSSEMSNIIGFEFLNDGKVASGCDWGNILVWANNKLSFELTTRRTVTCHQTPVFAFHRHNAWLISIGTDGWVRAWDLDKLSALKRDDRLYCRNESVVYFTIGEHSSIFSKIELPTEPNGLTWLLQDALGAIWLANVGPTLEGAEQAPTLCKQLLKCHAGKIISMAVCPYGQYLATIGLKGRLLVHNYETRQILDKFFEMEATSVAWLPLVGAQQLIIGFENGSLSLCSLHWESDRILEIQGIRPHDKPVTKISFNQNATLCATASEDLKVFLVSLQSETGMHPIGFIEIHQPILSTMFLEEEILICCKNALIYRYTLKSGFEIDDPSVSFKLKTEPQQEIDLKPNFSPGKEELKIVHCEQWSSMELILFVQEEENMIIAIFNTKEKNLKQISATATTLRLTSACISGDKSCCLMGFETGEIQFNTISSALDAHQQQPQHPEWSRFWRIRMHESESGCQVSAVGFSHDATFLFSSGDDGSIFMYKIASKTSSASIKRPIERENPAECKSRGIAAKNCTKSVEKIRMQKAEKRNSSAIVASREQLLKEIALLREEYEVSEQKSEVQVMHPLLQEFFEAKVRMMRMQKLALIKPKIERKREEWAIMHACFLQPLQSTCLKVAGIGEECSVESFLIAKPRVTPHTSTQAVSHVAINAPLPQPTLEAAMKAEFSVCVPQQATLEVEKFDASSFHHQRKSVSTASQVAEKLKQRQIQRNSDLRKLEALEKCKPKRKVLNINIGETSMGVYRLKTDAEYSVPEVDRIGCKDIKEYMELIKQKIYDIKLQFNSKVLHLKRERKQIHQELANSVDIADIDFVPDDTEKPDEYLFKLCTSTDMYDDIKSKKAFKSVDEIISNVSQFDAKVRSMIEERLKLDVNICLLKQYNFLLDQKYDIISQMEARQVELKGSLKETEDSKKTILENMSDLQGKLALCREEVDALQSQIEKLEEDVTAAIEGTVFYEHLMLLYRKEYRPPSLSIASSVTEGSDENRSGTSSAGSTCKGVSEKVCPAGCDQDLFDYINHCRLLRYEIDLKLMDKNRILNLMLKDEDVLKKKLKLAEKNIHCIIQSTDLFYRERQSKINDLQIAVPLKLHQIPAGAEFSKCVLISLKTMDRLSSRSGELQDEAAKLDAQYQQDLGILKELKGKITAIEEEIKQTNAKIEETMIQRFGKIVDIVELEQAVLGCEIENLTKPKYLDIDAAEVLECKRLEKEKEKLGKEVAVEIEVKKKKSKILADLLKEINSRTNPDDSKHKNCSREKLNDRRSDIRRLNELVLAQREQIAAVRYELDLLRCKVASSRYLFAADSDESTNNEDADAYKQRRITSRKVVVAPEILIEHCENESEQSEADENLYHSGKIGKN